jgi:hypothetical protein
LAWDLSNNKAGDILQIYAPNKSFCQLDSNIYISFFQALID